MALTLIEAAKRAGGDDIRSAVIEIYAQSSDLLRVLPFEQIEGNALRYNQEDTLPGIGFRGVNEGYSESVGVLNPVTEPLVIAGGDLDVDKFIERTASQNGSQRAAQVAMKIKSLAHKWTNTFIKGDSTTTPKEFDGIQVRLTGNQLIANGSTSGGDPLSLNKLDELIDAVDDPSHLLMSKAMRRLLTAASRDTSVGGHINYAQDEFGRRVTVYNDLPILIMDANASAFATLAFDEANPGGGSNVGTSIYCVSLRDQMLTGIENGGIDAVDLGEQDSKPVLRTRVEWYSGIAVWHPRAAGRLYGIKDAAVTV